MAFKDAVPSKKRGLKIDNAKSTVPIPPPASASLNEEAKQAFAKVEDYKQRAWDLGAKLKSIVLDKTLMENKSPITKDLEAETLMKLIALASEMNADDDQPEGVGGTAISFLMMKMILLQRDNINSLEFKLSQLEKTTHIKE